MKRALALLAVLLLAPLAVLQAGAASVSLC